MNKFRQENWKGQTVDVERSPSGQFVRWITSPKAQTFLENLSKKVREGYELEKEERKKLLLLWKISKRRIRNEQI